MLQPCAYSRARYNIELYITELYNIELYNIELFHGGMTGTARCVESADNPFSKTSKTA